MVIYTDCSAVAHGGQKKAWKLPTFMANGDVWDEIESIMENMPGKVEFQKVESHLEEGDLNDKEGRTRAAKSGNDRADEIAGHAASKSTVEEGTAKSVYMWIARAKAVQDRIYDIEQSLAKVRAGNRPKPLGPKDLAPHKKQRLLKKTGHNLREIKKMKSNTKLVGKFKK